MIIVRLKGGMGNQMFQYAMARRLAYQNHDLFKLDISDYSQYQKRSYSLGNFNIIEDIAAGEEIMEAKKRYYVPERYFHFDSAMLSLNTNLYLDGFWQSEKYFKDIENLVRKEFSFKNPPSEVNCRFIPFIEKSDSVSVHIRRGDYVSNPITYQYHGTCSPNYYYQAIRKLAKNVTAPHFFIFTNDLAWAWENIKIGFPCTFIATNNEERGYEDLRLMSLCKHHIIANSTFSWWGAWLSQYPQKIVYVPPKWFNDPTIKTDDLIPQDWNIVKCEG